MRGFLKNIFAVAGLSLLMTTQVFAQVEGSVGGRPANPDPDNPRSSSIFIYSLKAGDIKNDQIYLSNSGDTDITVELFAVDSTLTNTGAISCKQNVEDKISVGKWISLSQKEVTVEGRGNKLVDFTINVPQKVDVGEHGGCIAIQKKGDDGEQTGSVIITSRTAVRVAVMVPGAIHREISVKDIDARSRFNMPISVDFVLKNSGNVSADVRANIAIRNILGKEVFSQDTGEWPVASDSEQQLNQEVDFRPFFGGLYKIQLDTEYDRRAGAFGTTDSDQLSKVQSKEILAFVWPSIWFFMLSGLLLVSTVLFLLWQRGQTKTASRKASRSLKKSSGQVMWGPYTVKSGDTIASLARRHKVTSEKLAGLNRLSVSSKLEVGQRIYVPRKK